MDEWVERQITNGIDDGAVLDGEKQSVGDNIAPDSFGILNLLGQMS